MVKFVILILLTLSLNSTEAQEINLPPQLVFDFKGYKVELHDFTKGSHEQYLFVGTIDFLEAYEGEADTMIHNLFEFIHLADIKTGILIFTDANFNVLKILPSLPATCVTYDPQYNQYFIGTTYQTQHELGQHQYSDWQAALVVANTQMETKSYYMESENNSLVRKIVVDQGDVLLFAESRLDTMRSFETRTEAIEVFRVNTAHSYESTILGMDATFLHITSKLRTKGKFGSVHISEISQSSSGIYFQTTTTNTKTGTNTHQFYQIKEQGLLENTGFSSFLNETEAPSEFIQIDNCIVDDHGTVQLLYYSSDAINDLYLINTELSFHKISSKTLVPFYFQNTFNRFIRLSNGFTLVIAPDKEKNWCYYLYNKSMKLKKTKTSTVSTNYQIQRLREGEKGRILCLFQPDSSKECKSILENIKIN